MFIKHYFLDLRRHQSSDVAVPPGLVVCEDKNVERMDETRRRVILYRADEPVLQHLENRVDNGLHVKETRAVNQVEDKDLRAGLMHSTCRSLLSSSTARLAPSTSTIDSWK